ncbi:MAG: hypothetical protein IJ908_07600 [Fibrobacter sp.]|nr:hypothetical protein [Fibrobacter sp.]
MENKVTKFGLRKMLAVLAVAFTCVCMWGCSDDVTMHWSDERSLGGVAGFVDDSLAIVSSARYWHEEVEPTFGLSYDYSGYAHPGLSLYNYRVQLDGPVWSDTLDNSRDDDFNYIRGQLSDSVIWGGDPKSEVSFWKIGEKPHKMKIKKLFDGCSIDVPYTTKLRTWFDGKILVLGNNRNPNIEGLNLDSLGDGYCQYGVLDTIQKVVTYKRLEGDLKWIKKCDDVRAWGDDVYCFRPGERAFEAVLLRNEKDTVDVPVKFTVGDFWGSILQPNANLCNLINGQVVCFGVVWRGGLSFYQNDETVVEY